MVGRLSFLHQGQSFYSVVNDSERHSRSAENGKALIWCPSVCLFVRLSRLVTPAAAGVSVSERVYDGPIHSFRVSPSSLLVCCVCVFATNTGCDRDGPLIYAAHWRILIKSEGFDIGPVRSLGRTGIVCFCSRVVDILGGYVV